MYTSHKALKSNNPLLLLPRQFVLGRLATLLERVVNGISYSEARISEWLWWLTALLSLTLSVLLLIIPFRILVCVAGLAIIATPPVHACAHTKYAHRLTLKHTPYSTRTHTHIAHAHIHI